MILEVWHTVYVPPSSHGAAQAHRFFFHSAKFNQQSFLVKKKAREVFQRRNGLKL